MGKLGCCSSRTQQRKRQTDYEICSEKSKQHNAIKQYEAEKLYKDANLNCVRGKSQCEVGGWTSEWITVEVCMF